MWTMTQTPAARSHLKDEAFVHLRALLLSGEFEPGSFLSERQLVARMGISKTPIRVALERLARDGFVEILPQRGVRVRELQPHEIIEHYELREALEAWIVRRAAERITESQLEQLRALVGRQRELRELVQAQADHLNPDDARAYIELDTELHLLLAEIAGNQEIVRIMRTLRERMARVVADIMLHNRSLLTSSIAEHERVLDALAQQDGERAAHELIDHLVNGKRQFVEREEARVEEDARGGS
jgi:DNA-binding GntR family transcriptional regulator